MNKKNDKIFELTESIELCINNLEAIDESSREILSIRAKVYNDLKSFRSQLSLLVKFDNNLEYVTKEEK